MTWQPPKPPVSQRALAALYTHGPCSVGTVSALIGEDDAAEVARALQGLVGSKIMTRAVRLPGTAEPVDLLYLRGNGVG